MRGVLLVSRCPVCGGAGGAPCHTCVADLRRAPVGEPIPAGFDRLHAVLAYEGAGRELVARLKYRNARPAVGWLAEAMGALVDPATVDVVTWAPTSGVRRRERGFDQAELLGRAMARRLDRPCRRLLRRVPGPPQTGRTAVERHRGPGFRAMGRRDLDGRRVLVVDDVVTTGATLATAAAALRRGGASEVTAVVAARTP